MNRLRFRFSVASALLGGLIGLSGAQAQTGNQPLPSSAQAGYFIFKLASSLQLVDTPATQCQTAAPDVSQLGNVTVRHSFVLPESQATALATLDDYTQNSRFTPQTSWNFIAADGLSRTYTDPDVNGYRYAVDLYPLSSTSTAMCVSLLATE